VNVFFHPEAREELIDTSLYYESKQPGLGGRFLGEVRQASLKISYQPQLFRILEGDIRKCRIRRFPYGVLFRKRIDRIEIIAVMQLNRKPGYWKERSR
ncbi:MAG: type II toxin-antitoxin system RelE/ParE family toxin, partial [Verrucomicrobiota bacterium]